MNKFLIDLGQGDTVEVFINCSLSELLLDLQDMTWLTVESGESNYAIKVSHIKRVTKTK